MRRSLRAYVAWLAAWVFAGSMFFLSATPATFGQEAVVPSPRLATDMAYDSESDRIIIFGGFTEARTLLGDTWAYDLDGNSWRNMNPSVAPPARSDPGMAYDSRSDRVVLFGGVGSGFVEVNDTWAYDFNTNTWENRAPATGPSPRIGHRMVYDTESDRIILVGGLVGSILTATPFRDTWAYDYVNNTWTQMTPATGPSAAAFQGLGYDAESDRVVLYGGDDSTSPKTWAYTFNANTWTDRAPSIGPAARVGSAMAYDGGSDRILLFGGGPTFTGPYSAETWAYDYNDNAWTEKTAASGPSARAFHAMAYDTQSDRVVMHAGCGGFEANCNNETWSYDLDSNTWTEMAPPMPTDGPGPDLTPVFIGIGAGVAIVVGVVLIWRMRKR